MITSWGRFPIIKNQCLQTLISRHDNVDLTGQKNFLPYGKGRSYGDSCLNENGILLSTKFLDHLIDFDVKKGIIRAESGISLASLLDIIVPQGWFLPVLPGTKYVTLGGAIANDIHGKNHHRAGTFGCHVNQFELLKSDHHRYLCSKQNNLELYEATIGGLGLTGLITWAEIQLKPIKNRLLDVELIQFRHLDEFFSINAESIHSHEYTVAWLDCQSTGKKHGRGIYMRANHNATDDSLFSKKEQHQLTFPFALPFPLVNNLSVRLFNSFYYNKKKKYQNLTQDYLPFFFPLDKINHWNKIYGKKGFLQYQCVVPDDHDHKVIKSLLTMITQAKQGSFLSVLKTFGNQAAGLLSFPMPGVTLALDFPNKGKKTFDCLDQLDKLVMECGGRVYPAKDARMSSEAFSQYYSNAKRFSRLIDPKFSSNFWRRVYYEQ